MKVAIITDLAFWYSDTMYLKELETRLQQEGITANVFTISMNPSYEKFDAPVGFIRIFKVFKLLKKLSDYDLIHVQFSFPLGYAFTLFRSLGLIKKFIVIHTHGADVLSVPEINYGTRRKILGKLFINFTWKKADMLITVCNKTKTEIENSHIIPKKIKLLYNGIDENLFCKKNEFDHDLINIKNNSDFIFISVAAFRPVINHKRMINSFKKLVEKYKSKYKIKLILIGENPDLKFKSTEHPDIIYLGKKNHSELPKFYALADAFILASLSEAHPWSLLEAMSCEIPVIASNVGGIPEILDNKKFRFNPLDEQDILKKFELIVEMSLEERKKIGILNRKKVLENFTIDKHIKELKKIYTKTCEE